MNQPLTPTINLSQYSVADLRKLQSDIAHEIATKGAVEKKRAVDEINAIANRLGVSLAELIGGSVKFKERKGSGPVPAQYRDPKNSENEWSGRGRQPKWVKEHVDAGGSLDALKIKQ